MHPRDAVLLGAPLMDGAAMDSVLKAKCEDLQRASDRMSYISSHDSLVILKNSLGSTRVQYILRASPCASHPALVRFDVLQRAILGRISNCELSDQHWMQANLPVRCGGLGIRSVALLAPSAFLASAAATLPTQAALLPVNFKLSAPGWVRGGCSWYLVSQIQLSNPRCQSCGQTEILR